MAVRLALAFLLVATLFGFPSIAEDLDFDFYALGLLWPGAYCSQTTAGCCKPTTGHPAEDFFVASFATYNETTEKPVTKCTDTPFSINDLTDINYQLTAYWSNIKCPSNNGRSTWRSAWKTYGVCSGLTVSGYFSAAIAARSEANVLQALADEGITPNGAVYDLEKVKAAIKEKLGVTPAIQCSKSPSGIQGLFQIYRIFLCFEPSGAIRECPGLPAFTCSASVQFMPFNISILKTTSGALEYSNPIVMPAATLH